MGEMQNQLSKLQLVRKRIAIFCKNYRIGQKEKQKRRRRCGEGKLQQGFFFV